MNKNLPKSHKQCNSQKSNKQIFLENSFKARKNNASFKFIASIIYNPPVRCRKTNDCFLNSLADAGSKDAQRLSLAASVDFSVNPPNYRLGDKQSGGKKWTDKAHTRWLFHYPRSSLVSFTLLGDYWNTERFLSLVRVERIMYFLIRTVRWARF